MACSELEHRESKKACWHCYNANKGWSQKPCKSCSNTRTHANQHPKYEPKGKKEQEGIPWVLNGGQD